MISVLKYKLSIIYLTYLIMKVTLFFINCLANFLITICSSIIAYRNFFVAKIIEMDRERGQVKW